MNNSKFINLISLSEEEIVKEITAVEIEIFNLRFKKVTTQTFKSHQLRFSKKKLAKLKTILNARVNKIEKQETNKLIVN